MMNRLHYSANQSPCRSIHVHLCATRILKPLQDRNIWSNVTKSDAKQFVDEFEFIVFDEAQRIKNIGLAVKMILDMKLQKQIIVSGSSPIV